MVELYRYRYGRSWYVAEAYGTEPRYIGVRYRAPLHRGSYVWACLMEELTTRIESDSSG